MTATRLSLIRIGLAGAAALCTGAAARAHAVGDGVAGLGLVMLDAGFVGALLGLRDRYGE